ncbi:class I SAM-dependent methyltransferase [Egicoccus sp. AB-alg6-2]|uniref:class I SAM-dependent methyltransferase n=1 Tax=Egicoccus sp. AB-alg6-2 TaxID=3242692 RepID=UPI00359DAEEE
MDEHTQVNLANWESRVPIHATSTAYGLQRFVDHPRHLSGVVAWDAPHLGDLRGKRVVHVQCHIGTDTLSLARLGAEVTGVDFSPAALEVARDLSERAGPHVRYVHAAVDEIPAALPETFDLVYTGVGAINWLPSIARWARIVAGLLAPGGRLYLREGHPMLGTIDDERDDDLLVVTYPYFETEEPSEWVSEVTYTGDDARLESPVAREWAHGLAETVQAVLDAGLTLTRLEEHTELEWQFLDGMVPTGDGRWALSHGRERLPLMFTLEAVKPG